MDNKIGVFLFNKETNEVQIGERTFSLTPVTKKELSVFRGKKIPSLVVKIGNDLYHTVLKRSTTISVSPCHCCSDLDHDCSRLRALSYEKGGCQKVVEEYKQIEDYDFITCGYETSYTQNDTLAVIKCENYSMSPPRPKFDFRKASLEYLSR